ncbi:hypothetical protein scyTo_0023330, partial [Scyliorhinus torazame]|nr:hypothetical protein [Scyliorhinus torazame]
SKYFRGKKVLDEYEIRLEQVCVMVLISLATESVIGSKLRALIKIFNQSHVTSCPVKYLILTLVILDDPGNDKGEEIFLCRTIYNID